MGKRLNKAEKDYLVSRVKREFYDKIELARINEHKEKEAIREKLLEELGVNRIMEEMDDSLKALEKVNEQFRDLMGYKYFQSGEKPTQYSHGQSSSKFRRLVDERFQKESKVGRLISELIKQQQEAVDKIMLLDLDADMTTAFTEMMEEIARLNGTKQLTD